MDWQRIKDAICAGRQFAVADGQCRVLSDTLMPSGALIYVHLQARQGGCLSGHDGGAAFDELARHGGDIRSLAGVRRLMHETEFAVSDDGLIWRHHIPEDRAFDAISLVADASVRAALFLSEKAKLTHADPLDRRLKDLLRIRFPQGRPNFSIQGRNRQHTFDFGVNIGGQMVLLQAVSPDQSSVSAAIVKGIDAKEAPGSNVVPLFVYDPADHWQSGTLGMLDFGGRGIAIDAIQSGTLPLAA